MEKNKKKYTVWTSNKGTRIAHSEEEVWELLDDLPIGGLYEVRDFYTDVEPWKPKEGEYICEKDFGLSIVISNIDGDIFCKQISRQSLLAPKFSTTLEDCEPFIGELPSFLKDVE